MLKKVAKILLLLVLVAHHFTIPLQARASYLQSNEEAIETQLDDVSELVEIEIDVEFEEYIPDDEDDYDDERPDLIEEECENEAVYDDQYGYEIVAEVNEYVPVAQLSANPVAFGVNTEMTAPWRVGAQWTLYDDGTLVVGGGMLFGGNGFADPWEFSFAGIPDGLNIYRIVLTEPVVGGPNLAWLFGGNNQNWQNINGQWVRIMPFEHLHTIENLHYLDTSNTTNMHSMFRNSWELVNFDVGGFDTSRVTNMMYMFASDGATQESMSFTYLDVSNWDVSNVTMMFGMFEGATQLTSLDVSHWDVGHVFDFEQMFMGAHSLVDLDVSNWDVSSARYMENMFAFTRSMESFDLNNWDVSNVRTMGQMFLDNNNLSEINVSNWDTGNVTTMWNMFAGTLVLRNIDFANWDTSNVTTFHRMFDWSGLEEFYAPNWDTSSVTNMGMMFSDAWDLTRVNIGGFDTSSVTNMNNMFARTTSLRELTLGDGWQTVGNPALPNVPTTAVYTGRWQNVAGGTVADPIGTHSLTSDVLINTAGGRPPVPDTWVWERLAHVVDFDLQSGSGDFPDQSVAPGGFATRPTAEPTREGWIFVNWYTAPTGGTPFNFATPITADTTVYARWSRVQFIVDFDLQGGTGDFPIQTINHGEFATAPAEIPTRVGYTFVDWFDAEEGGATFDFAAPITANTTIYARWLRTQLTVDFDLQGGTGDFPIQTVNHGELATAPTEIPTRAGWTFVNWYNAATDGVPFDFETPITTNTTIYARWSRTQLTVNFDLQGGTGDFPIQTVNHGELATAPTVIPTRVGYTFVDWFDAEEGGAAFNFETPITANTTIYARWSRTQLTVNFDLQGGTGDFPSQTVNHGEFAIAPTAIPTRVGWTFVDWFSAEEGGAAFNFETPITANTTIYARWSRTQLTVNFDLQGGTGDFPSQTVNHGEFAIAPTAIPTRVGWTFVNWYNAATGGVPFDFEAPITANTTIYARWERVQLTVTFMLNGGSHATLETNNVSTVYHGNMVEQPTPNPAQVGYEFLGWFYEYEVEVIGLFSRFMRLFNRSANERLFNFGTPITANLVLNARWEAVEEVVETLQVTFDLQGGTGDFPSQTVNRGALATAPTAIPTRLGYTFVGWYEAPLGGAIFDFNTPITTNITIYARWEAVEEVVETLQVTFDLQGGTGDFPSQTVNRGALATAPTAIPTRLGYTFVGWYEAPLGGAIFDFAMPVTTNITIYARWEAVEEIIEMLQVTFDLQGGTGDFPSQTVNRGEFATAPTEIPTRLGYTFVGWYEAPLGGAIFDFNTPITTNITIYARWEAVEEIIETLQVTFDLQGGTGDFPSQTVNRGALATAPTEIPTRLGYTFVGWYDVAEGGAIFDFAMPITTNTTIYARWEAVEEVIETLQVTFDLQGGTGDFPSQTVNRGALATAPTAIPTRLDYTFVGWYEAPLGGAIFDFATPITENTTIYARWEAIGVEREPQYVIVTFIRNHDADDDTVVTVIDIESGLPIGTLPAYPLRDGYQFIGWFTARTDGNLLTDSTIVVDSMTIYAQWQPVLEPPIYPTPPTPPSQPQRPYQPNQPDAEPSLPATGVATTSTFLIGSVMGAVGCLLIVWKEKQAKENL